MAGPSHLAVVCRGATRSTAFPTPQDFKSGICLPPKMAAGMNAIRLDEIIGGQRRMQLLSVLLTVSGALELAFLYRDILIGAASRRSSEPVEEPACRDSTRSQPPGARRKTLDEETHTKKPNKMKAIRMRIQKSSRPGVILMATVVAIITSMVAANATQTITTPNAAFISYNLVAGANSAAVTPVTNKSVLAMGCETTAGGVGQVSLLHTPGVGMTWAPRPPVDTAMAQREATSCGSTVPTGWTSGWPAQTRSLSTMVILQRGLVM